MPEPVEGPPYFGDGRLSRARTWLYLRCGLEARTVLALAVVLAVAGGLALHHFWTGRPRTVRVAPASASALLPRAGFATSSATFPSAAPAPFLSVGPSVSPSAVTVDVAGKVARPGLRRLPRGARVADALTAAGGPLPGTDTTALNLARPLADGEQILVGIAPPPQAPGAEAPSGEAAGPVHLNTATEPQLDALPGVGPVLAQHILAFRAAHGSFSSAQQLREIPGIGPRKFAMLQPLVQP
ncbi:ComEA family DNA-binding protein [Actinacidiphila yeochonensis]|uniref:ComEA family DNA-binding protein n=1 Tax=Actinacidiphila yeochonensis TaxID=89050 RepID=UPI001E4B59CA|nr:ComEA family DNA-binding protein [Actinacidiphila yeochonensis]